MGVDKDRGLCELAVDHIFDGGDLDCGSGLVLLIRQHMLEVPEHGVLEMRSVEATVCDDLPPWCRMVGHEYLGYIPGDQPAQRRFFVRKTSGKATVAEATALADDKKRADDFEWRLRARASGHLKTTVYCRNFQWELGQPVSFEEKDAHPAAVEAALGALAGDLVTGFATACSRAGLEIDDIELTAKGHLVCTTAHLGLAEGDPAFADITVRCFASSFDDEETIREVWADVVRRSPLAATLAKACELSTTIAII